MQKEQRLELAMCFGTERHTERLLRIWAFLVLLWLDTPLVTDGDVD